MGRNRLTPDDAGGVVAKTAREAAEALCVGLQGVASGAGRDLAAAAEKLIFDVEAAAVAGTDGEGCLVGLGDSRDDGQAEAEAVVVGGPIGGQALERLEEPADLAGGITSPVLMILSVEWSRPDVT